MFHRSTMTDEKLTNLAMISIESETAKICDMFELTKTFPFLKTWKSPYPRLKHPNAVSFIRCADAVENAFISIC